MYVVRKHVRFCCMVWCKVMLGPVVSPAAWPSCATVEAVTRIAPVLFTLPNGLPHSFPLPTIPPWPLRKLHTMHTHKHGLVRACRHAEPMTHAPRIHPSSPPLSLNPPPQSLCPLTQSGPCERYGDQPWRYSPERTRSLQELPSLLRQANGLAYECTTLDAPS